MAFNNRKTTHRRSNGKVVIVRHRQYPTKPNNKRKIHKGGHLIQKGHRSMIRHIGMDILQKPIHNENLPNKGRPIEE